MVQITPENIFVFYSFESILSGLLAFVLLWLVWKRRALRQTNPYFLLASLFTLAFALFICSSLNFYEFYHQEKALQHDPEDIACGFFLISVVLLGLAFHPPTARRIGWTIPLAVGAGLGLVDLITHLMGYGHEDVPLHFLAVAALLIFLSGTLPKGDRNRKTQLLVRVTFLGLALSFVFFSLLKALPGDSRESSLIWMAQHVALLASLVALAHVVESDSRDLFVKFFIRLNLTFIFLAGFIILLVTGVQRQEYVSFAAREAEDLLEFLRGHVMYFHHHGYEDREVLSNPEITKRIVADFANIPDLRSVRIRLNELHVEVGIDAAGLVERSIEPAGGDPSRTSFQPAIEGNQLRLAAPIYGSAEIAGWVELNESLASMNQAIASQIMIIFSAFTVIVILSSILIGIIVTQADATIHQQYRELEETHERLLQAGKLAALGEMAGGVAHEINNPLAVILGRANYLSTLARRKQADGFLEDLEVIENNATRAAKIISDLLDFSRPRPLNRASWDLNDVLAQTLELMRPRLTACGLTVEKGFAALPPVHIDCDRMQQVFVNLINNAIDACSNGGEIRLRTRLRNGWVEAIVEDTGVGISAADQKKIFDPFFTTKERGTGLGLSVSYSIVRDHGGQILVQSEPGRGSRFAVRLPSPAGGSHDQ